MEQSHNTSNMNIKIIQNPEAYPGYPNRRIAISPNSINAEGEIIVPDGEWTMNNNPLPTTEEIIDFKHKNLSTDSVGRPLSPLYETELFDPLIGAITGKGNYYNWGPNYTADSVVMTRDPEPKILLIQRKDTGLWALPGGFLDNNENAIDAAIRELKEETNLTIENEQPVLIYKGLVDDPRATINSWPETTAYLWKINETDQISAGDDAQNTAWYNKNEMPTNLFGSHKYLIKLAFEHQYKSKLVDMLNSSDKSNDITETSGGHMAYEHLIISGQDKSIFVKTINLNKLHNQTDAKNLQKYIQKEKMYYDHLTDIAFSKLPSNIDFVDDKTLVMDALLDKDQWKWRIPKNDDSNKYIADILDTLSQLNNLDVPYHIDEYLGITPTHITLWDEGWAGIDDNKIRQINQKIESFNDMFRPESKNKIQNLLNNLSNLKDIAAYSRKLDNLVLSHNDARQSNIAWHPDQGVKIVDWAWAGLAPEKADSTMFLIDLAKSGYDVDKYLSEHFDKNHATTLIGFWLNHCMQSNPNDSETIRFQQVVSALAAYELINKI